MGLAPRALPERPVALLAGLAVLATLAVLALPPIPQDPGYHRLADARTLLGVPNALNVLSNLPFVAVGVLGLAFLRSPDATRPGGPFVEPWERRPYTVAFLGVALTGLGSGWYHLAPATPRLFWDRLPLVVVFTAVLAAVVGERVGGPLGRRLLAPLVGAGLAALLYWRLGEGHGAGDLRFYGLAQFYPMAAIPLLLWRCPPRYTRTADLAGVVAWYGGAKLFELLDHQVFALGRVASGHTVKHLLSAAAAWWLLRMLRLRRPVDR